MPLELGDLNAHLATAATEGVRRQSDSSTSFIQVLDRAFLQKYLEVDPVQAAAIKDIQRGAAPAPTSVQPGGQGTPG